MKGRRVFALVIVLGLMLAVPIGSQGAAPAVFDYPADAEDFFADGVIQFFGPLQKGGTNVADASVVVGSKFFGGPQVGPIKDPCRSPLIGGNIHVSHYTNKYSNGTLTGAYVADRLLLAGRFSTGPWKGRLVALSLRFGSRCTYDQEGILGKVVTV